MKKSEAINIITNTLLEKSDGFVKPGVIGFESTPGGKRDKIREAAEAVLEALLQEGMKPPLSKRCPVLLTNIHVWEDEEKKEKERRHRDDCNCHLCWAPGGV